MSIEVHSAERVTIKQLIDAGTRCGIEITKSTKHSNTYTMTWDVDDYAEYAERMDKSAMRAFCERIEPVGERFVMERDFQLDQDGVFSYDYLTRCDDAGIANRLMAEAGVQLECEYDVCWEYFPKKDEMEQYEVAQIINEESNLRPYQWSRTGYEIPEESMEQDEVALSVEVGNDE